MKKKETRGSKVGDYYKEGEKYVVLADNGIEHRMNDIYNAMLLSRMLRTTKESPGRPKFDLDYQKVI